jgi:hypothetical protein
MSEQNAIGTTPTHSPSTLSAPSTPSALVARGFALFPLRAGSKAPAVARDWEHTATTSLVRLRRLTTDPGANYAIACGPSNLLVIDIDVAKRNTAPAPGAPASGLEVLRDLAGDRAVPRTFTVSTPSGGRHLYFRPPSEGPELRNTVRRIGPLIDTRGIGGYVVAPGSRVDGVVYEILDDAPIAELPAWIASLLRPFEARPAVGEPLPLATALGPIRARLGSAYAVTALTQEAARVESATVGTRNDTLNRAAYSLGTLVGGGILERSEVEAELTQAALAAGLDARGTASTLRSGLTAGIARPRRPAGFGASAAAADTSARPVAGARQPSLDEAIPAHDGPPAEPPAASRPLIPTLLPRIAAWPRVFGTFERLGSASAALRHELAACVPDFTLPSGSARQPTGGDAAPALATATATATTVEALAELLADLDDAYESAARVSGPIGGSARWLGIQSLEDSLRDVRDELTDAATLVEPALNPQAFGLVWALTAAAARHIAVLTKEISIKLGADGLRRSPLWNALRRLQAAADSVTAFGTLSNGRLTPAGFAAGRGALQAQLGAMRRDLHAAGRDRPAAATG